MKNAIYQRLLLYIVVAVGAAEAEAAKRWELNFENGFNASSGTLYLVGGDANNPADATKDIYLLYDPSANGGAGSSVVKVGKTGTHDCWLAYTGLDPNILGNRGKVTLKFKFDPNQT